MNNSPCKGCTERQQGCHGKCKRYKIWIEEHEKEKAFLAETKKSDEDFHRARWRWQWGIH